MVFGDFDCDGDGIADPNIIDIDDDDDDSDWHVAGLAAASSVRAQLLRGLNGSQAVSRPVGDAKAAVVLQ